MCCPAHRPEFNIWFMSLQSQYIECVQALQQLGVISQVPGVSAAVINNTTQQSMHTRGHCSRRGGGQEWKRKQRGGSRQPRDARQGQH